MRYRLLCVGRRAQDPLLEAADGYLKRLSVFAKSDVVRLREGSPESERGDILAKLDRADYVVTLDERGPQLTTMQWTAKVTNWESAGRRFVTFIVGGADGLHPDVKARAQESLGLSPLTLPHRLAQVVLLEQLYRVHSILRGTQYHRV